MAHSALGDATLDRVDHPDVLFVDASAQERGGVGGGRIGPGFDGKREGVCSLPANLAQEIEMTLVTR